MRIQTIVVLLISLGASIAGAGRASALPVDDAPTIEQAPTNPVATVGDKFAFDYPDADVAAGAVTRFEQSLDGGAFASIGMSVSNDAQTPPASKTYVTPIPALTPGTHQVRWRACNLLLCGDPSTPFAFELAVKPSANFGGKRIK